MENKKIEEKILPLNDITNKMADVTTEKFIVKRNGQSHVLL